MAPKDRMTATENTVPAVVTLIVRHFPRDPSPAVSTPGSAAVRRRAATLVVDLYTLVGPDLMGVLSSQLTQEQQLLMTHLVDLSARQRGGEAAERWAAGEDPLADWATLAH